MTRMVGGAANIVTASYNIIPTRHSHSHILAKVSVWKVIPGGRETPDTHYSDRDVGSVGKDELDILKFAPSSPGLC